MLPLSNAQITQIFQRAQSDFKRSDYFAALAAFEQLRQALPKAPEPLFHLGRTYFALGRLQRARSVFEQARALAPGEEQVLIQLARTYARLGEREAALDAHDDRIKKTSGSLAAYMDKALTLQQFGAFEEAEQIFRKVYGQARKSGEFFRIWFAGRKFTSSQDKALKAALSLWKSPALAPKERLNLGFALAKAMEDLQQYDAVFRYLDRANADQRTLAPFDPEEHRARLQDMVNSAPEEKIARRGTSDFAPIIVTGMPRSGTTLIEQILAAHPQVRASGELAKARLLTYLTFGPAGHVPPISTADVETLDLFAERYAAASRETAQGDAPRITDKSIGNYLVLGHIAAAMPKAHVIVVRRDPRDVALSIYKNHFALGTHRYANSLDTIAAQMAGFEEAVRFWKGRVPLTEVSYDDLTANPEGQTRALIQAAGLDWDDACLDHTAGQSAVTTLSIAQVREPIHRRSTGGWRRYEAQMQPFIEAWEAGP
ncbi:tetratricopeptide repeat-containing sulfotransferase family protein [Primorskyibacter sp. S187A]|uniref:tetratricopeptide repeat-containing sulfotransferase family protein n=1 Tax=Primorskyibacter sp. S187A TaxID=3415130 RepID=UPI003C7C194B